MWDPCKSKPLTIVTGHYGTGKTNLSINMALDLVACDPSAPVVLADLDVVNPYFRSSDSEEFLNMKGIEVAGPTFARSTLDTPSLSAQVNKAFQVEDRGGHAIIDVGGDDAGATILGRYRKEIDAIAHDFFYVINRNRNLTTTAKEAVQLLREIEDASGLTATGIVNNSHLHADTTVDVLLASLEFADEVAELASLPLVFTTIPNTLLCNEVKTLYPDVVAQSLYSVKRYVHAPWEEDPSELLQDQ